MKKIIIFIAFLISAQASADYQLMFAGGALKTCSSMSIKNCKDATGLKSSSVIDFSKHKQQEYYQVTSASLREIDKSNYFKLPPGQIKSNIIEVLTEVKKLNENPLSYADFKSAFRSVNNIKKEGDDLSGENLFDSLSDWNWYLMLDYLQVYQASHSMQKAEKVILSESRYESTQLIFKRFVEMARNASEKPTNALPVIAYLTSSSRDPFEAVDFYRQVFQQSGAVAVWLPVDIAVMQAIRAGDCGSISEFRAKEMGVVNREQLYPELTAYQSKFCEQPEHFIQAIENADGIFINGGDQFLTLQALMHSDITNYKKLHQDSQILAMIRRRVAEGSLVVGGTSAGAAVQSGGVLFGTQTPMITSGESYNGLTNGVFAKLPPNVGCTKDLSCGAINENDVTYQPMGGLGLIAAGLIDTHFSERGRQMRLIQLALSTKTAFAFGVDETSALLANESDSKLHFEVTGRHGVWVFDLRKAESKLANGKKIIVNVVAHYLSEGDRMIIDKLTGDTQITFREGKKHFAQPRNRLYEKDIFYADNFRSLAHSLALSQRIKAEGVSRENSPGFHVTLTKSNAFKSVMGVVKINETERLNVSYSDLLLSIRQINP